jgi:hypothetical protein
MIGRTLRPTLTATVAALALLSAPRESLAIFHWLFPNCCGSGSTFSAGYAPAPTVCNYVPQTCYRTVYVNTPVVAYRPVTSCDPCTGCPTTCYRPVTTYVTQARLVPYTTYRPVYAARPVCSPCGTSTPAYYAPGYAATSSNCSCNGSSYVSSPVTRVSPGTTIRSLGPAQPSADTTPSLNSPPANSILTPRREAQPNGGGTGRTFLEGQPADPAGAEPETNLRPLGPVIDPSKAKSGSSLLPKLLDPQDRTTFRAPRPTTVQRASAVSRAPRADDEPIQEGQWRAARR